VSHQRRGLAPVPKQQKSNPADLVADLSDRLSRQVDMTDPVLRRAADHLFDVLATAQERIDHWRDIAANADVQLAGINKFENAVNGLMDALESRIAAQDTRKPE
jgi:hypothetical protein